MEDIKKELLKVCQDYLHQRIRAAREAIAVAQEAANDETKSSSGDKYETGRAMMQLEVEKNTVQLSESVKLRHALDRIGIENAPDTVQPGSLVVTDKGTFFVAISLGKVTLHENEYFVISPASPVGSKLIGLRSCDEMKFKDQVYVVHEVK